MLSATLHASAVELGGNGCLILGASGAGKSTLALELIGLGAALVSDDRTVVISNGEALTLAAPAEIAGRIEAHGVGILSLPHNAARLALIADLDRFQTVRLPAPRYRHLLGLPCPIILAGGRVGLAAILRTGLENGNGAWPWGEINPGMKRPGPM